MKSNNIYYVLKAESSSLEILKPQIFPDMPYLTLAVGRAD